MDGIIILIVVLSIVSSFAKRFQAMRQKAAGQSKSAPPASRGDLFPKLFPEEAPKQPVKTEQTPKQAAVPSAPITPVAPRTITASVAPRMGKDGEDDCHEYMLKDASSMPSDTEKGDAASEFPLSFTREGLLQGVIMSEILTRPAVRKARRYGSV